jgi:5-dehydro-2-deoxygluconokinase
MSAFDVITMGRIGVDVYPLQTGVSLREVESFGKYLGGSATSVAVAAARYRRRTAVITRTGTDPFGDFLHDALRRFGVDDRWVSAVAGLPTPVTFCEILPPDDFPLYFYREPKAPDLQIAAHELDLDAIRSARVSWATVTGLSQEPSRSATLAALQARVRSGITVLVPRPARRLERRAESCASATRPEHSRSSATSASIAPRSTRAASCPPRICPSSSCAPAATPASST